MKGKSKTSKMRISVFLFFALSGCYATIIIPGQQTMFQYEFNFGE